MPITARPDGLELRGVAVEYRQQKARIRALSVERLLVGPGALCGFAGPSGSGKTTLLHVVAGLLRPAAGEVRWGGTDIAALSEPARDRWRRRSIGFVFQDFLLIPELSALDNVLLPVWFGAAFARPRRPRAEALLREVGIPDARRRAGVLSRGEQQRVAIARALLHGPGIILADEPTASLDAATGEAVIDLLVGSARAAGATLLAVSHDARLLARMDVVHGLEQGRLA